MRLHVLTNLFPPDVLGGYELLAADVVGRLRARGHTITVVTSGQRGGDAEVARILHLSRRFSERASADRLRHVAVAVANRVALGRFMAVEGRPDAVLVMSMRRLGLEPLRVYADADVPAVLTVNDDWPVSYARSAGATPLQRVLDRAFRRNTWDGLPVSRVVYLSDRIREFVRASGAPLPDGPVRAQGVDLAHFHPRPFVPMSATATKLLFVGRLHPTKAPDVAIDTLIALRARGVDASLTIAGAANDSAYWSELRARAQPVADHVLWLSHIARTRLRDVYASADVLLYPLRWDGEAQGLTYMEAMATGVPVVAFPRGGARELLDAHDVVGRAASCDGHSFADAITALAGDVARQRALVRGGQSLVREHASLDRYVDALESELACAVKATDTNNIKKGEAA
jgi:glycosyltransferase involved in cell wall biosynthesis